VAVPARACAAVLAAGLAAVAATLPANPPVTVPLAAAGAGLAVALLPRLGWIAAAAFATGWLAFAPDGLPGAALLIALALAVTPPLLWRAGPWWSAPALGPLLGLVSLAGAFPAVAGQARTAWQRAALGALGAWWLALAEPLLGRDLYLGRGDGTAPRHEVAQSVSAVVHHALRPLATTELAMLIATWALAAAVLPLIVRGRSRLLDLAAAGAWATALAVAGSWHASATASLPRGWALGAVAAGLVAFAVRRTRGPVPARPRPISDPQAVVADARGSARDH
jgi:hypothetical protein